MRKNNLFMFATSELSQDAFICWLLNFAHKDHQDEDPILKECAKEFLSFILPLEEELVVTDIKRQYNEIDVLITVNDKYNIIIEDKTFTGQNGNQIQRYKEKLSKKGYQNIICVYYKIVEQAEEEQDIININRSLLIGLFSKYEKQTTNQIFLNYYEYLLYLDWAVNCYKTEPIKNWTGIKNHAYKGFFTHLINDKIIETDKHYSWNYVPNRSGGINALWWYFVDSKNLSASNLSELHFHSIYLQIENNIIAVKMSVKDNYSVDVRWSLYQYIKVMVPYFTKKAFQKGKSMTIGYIEYDENNYKEKIDLMEKVMASIENGTYKYV